MNTIRFRNALLAIIILLCANACTSSNKANNPKLIPATFLGSFTDDYNIGYVITPTSFKQSPGIAYSISRWDIKNEYIIAIHRDSSNAVIFTRIDYMTFENMSPFEWGFCYTNYTATNIAEALSTEAADRQNPKKGCNGFPFSRMKRKM